MDKIFLIDKENIKKIIPNKGSGYATDSITVKGEKVGIMYRENPNFDYSSGWFFLAMDDTQEYIDDPKNILIYDLNTIANYDEKILPYLDYPIGSYLVRNDDDTFQLIED